MERTGQRGSEAHVGRGRRGAPRLALAGAVLFGLTILFPGARAVASRPARTGWWQLANQGPLQAPAPADVPAGGLYVQGGPSVDQPAAIAAVGFDLPPNSGAGALKLHLASPTDAPSQQAPASVPAGPSSPAPPPAVKACIISAGTFSPEENGPAADIPPYDCTGAVDGVADPNGVITFAIGGLVRAGSLAVAIVPTGPSDRGAFSAPGDDALAITPIESVDPPTVDAAAPTAPSDAYGGLYPTFDNPAITSNPSGSGTLITPPTAAVVPRRAVRPTTPITSIKADAFSKAGQLLAIGLLLAALISYVRGFGLLGGRLIES